MWNDEGVKTGIPAAKSDHKERETGSGPAQTSSHCCPWSAQAASASYTLRQGAGEGRAGRCKARRPTITSTPSRTTYHVVKRGGGVCAAEHNERYTQRGPININVTISDDSAPNKQRRPYQKNTALEALRTMLDSKEKEEHSPSAPCTGRVQLPDHRELRTPPSHSPASTCEKSHTHKPTHVDNSQTLIRHYDRNRTLKRKPYVAAT